MDGQLTAGQSRTARHLLLRMVEPGHGTTLDTRRPLSLTQLQDYPNPDVRLVVDRLVRPRLVTADEDGVRLAHEALITCWRRLFDRTLAVGGTAGALQLWDTETQRPLGDAVGAHVPLPPN